MTKEDKCQKVFSKHYIIAFWITLVLAIGLIVGGFFTPPRAEISGSLITAVGEIFLWPSLALGAKSLEERKMIKLQKGETTISIGNNDNENG